MGDADDFNIKSDIKQGFVIQKLSNLLHKHVFKIFENIPEKRVKSRNLRFYAYSCLNSYFFSLNVHSIYNVELY